MFIKPLYIYGGFWLSNKIRVENNNSVKVLRFKRC